MIKEDTILIQNILKGDSNSENELYEKYKQIVESFLLKKYSSYIDFLDDNVSEILTKVFFKLKSYDESKSKFKSWVLSIANNHMIDKWRTNSSSCYTVNSLDLNSVNTLDGNYCYTMTNSSGITNDMSFTSCDSSEINNIDNVDTVTYISNQLSCSDFTLLEMKYVHGYNYNEIGQEFNITSDTASNKVNYIKSKIKNKNLNIEY